MYSYIKLKNTFIFQVLTLLQATGCNYTVLEGGQFVSLRNLKALHIQGYAYKDQSQISGYIPSKAKEKTAEEEEEEQIKHLNLVLTEDVLKPLVNLQLLDLQFVRLLAERDAGRLRRFSRLHPISHTTLLDLPLDEFKRITDYVERSSRPISSLYRDPSFEYLTNDINPFIRNKASFDDYEEYNDSDEDDYESEENDLSIQASEELSNFIEEKAQAGYQNSLEVSLMDEGNPDQLVSYDVYKAETEPYLAPFRTLSQLKYLRLAHAKLDKIGSELLQGLERIHTLTLEHNQIRFLPDALFMTTPGLRHLSIAYNYILELKLQALAGLDNLLTLDLDHNKLSIIGPSTFPSLPSLNTIRLNGNPITHVLPDAFTNINQTENLYIGASDVSTDVHIDAFTHLNNLKVLVIQNITLPSLIKDFIPGTPNLRQLTLHGNLSTIEFDTFSEAPLLEIIDLSMCNIAFISMDAFFNLENLRLLNLSHNEITSLNPGTFDHLPKLFELYLNDNKLKTIPPGLFMPTPAELVHVYNNPWDCSCNLIQLTPTTTNKMKRKGYVECQWHEKLPAVCKTTPDRVVYDTRVAPLCTTPFRLKGQDVFHAALRYLNCSKDILHENKEVVNSTRQVKTNTTRKIVKIKTENKATTKYNRFLPLIAYTPPTIPPKDLLKMAELDGLEEILESDYENDFNDPEETLTTQPTQKPKSNFLQNDQQMMLTKKEELKAAKKLREEYQKNKKKIKEIMRLEEIKRRRELEHKKRKATKAALKAKMKLKEARERKYKKKNKKSHSFTNRLNVNYFK